MNVCARRSPADGVTRRTADEDIADVKRRDAPRLAGMQCERHRYQGGRKQPHAWQCRPRLRRDPRKLPGGTVCADRESAVGLELGVALGYCIGGVGDDAAADRVGDLSESLVAGDAARDPHPAGAVWVPADRLDRPSV